MGPCGYPTKDFGQKGYQGHVVESRPEAQQGFVHALTSWEDEALAWAE